MKFYMFNSKLKEVLSNFNFHNYELDEYHIFIKKAILEYLRVDTNSRQEIRNIYTENDFLKLLNLSDCLVEEAYNKKDKSILRQAIALHSIEDFRFDNRENIIRLSILWYVSLKLEIIPQGLFEYGISISSDKTGVHFKEFIDRPNSMKGIDVMNIIEIEKGNRITFVPKPSPW